jgi:magnesium transporter
MARFVKNKKRPYPGSLTFVGTKKLDKVRVKLIQFDAKTIVEQDLTDIRKLPTYERPELIQWLDIDGLHDMEVIRTIGDHYNLHPMLLQDVLDTGHRSNVDEYDNALLVSLKMLRFDEAEPMMVKSEQVSFVLHNRGVISFQEMQGDVFDPIRHRIRNQIGRICQLQSDYLLYALVNCIVEGYMDVIENIGAKIEKLEYEVLDSYAKTTLARINFYKREATYLLRMVRPSRDAIVKLSKISTPLLSSAVAPYYQDLHDSTLNAGEALDAYRELVRNSSETFDTNVNRKLNEVMKVLTIISVIFVPLTFLAGVYGMNFKHFPELEWRWAYPMFWAVSGIIFVGMLITFKIKRWF